MEFPGHVGAALLAYAPIGFATTASTSPRLALTGAATTVVLASLPDVDEHAPGMNHRGHVHTVWFAVLVGIVCGGAFAFVGTTRLGIPPSGLAAFGFVVGTTAVLSHIAADALTPMGIAPIAPVSDRRYSLRVVRSASPRANRLFLLAGVGATLLTFAVGWFVR